MSPVANVLIVGGSHAGLSAALTLYRALHTSVIFDTREPRNHYSTPVRLTSTWENKPPEEMRDACRKELLEAGFTKFVDSRVKTIRKTAEGLFELTDDKGSKWLGHKVLLSYGARDVFPAIPGYSDVYARGVYPCMFQFGYEYRGSPSGGLLAVDSLANPEQAAILAKDGHRFADAMTIYTNGDVALAERLRGLLSDRKSISVDTRKIVLLSRSESKPGVVIDFEDGSRHTESFVVHRPLTAVDRTLPDQLGIEMSKMGEIQAMPPFYRTNVPGVYAAGDCATPMKTIANAMTMGSYAACGLARELENVVA
ncbi:FAD/NAD(P)-binding domain-containing protein [Xylaria intraflava]|nr:FAD/NAD(P)-binding domain-containing protein [Xylaria intraflava]